MAARRREPPDPGHLAEVALRYVQHGWPVLPIHTPGDRGCSCTARDCGSPGKHPRTARGLHDASTDADRIRGWWDRWPNANIGVVTGAPSGLVVLDVDLPDGPDSLARLQAEVAVTRCHGTAGNLIGVGVLAHVGIGRGRWTSFACRTVLTDRTLEPRIAHRIVARRGR